MNQSGLLQEGDIPYAQAIIMMFANTDLPAHKIVEVLRRILADIEYEADRYTGPVVIEIPRKKEHI